MLSAPSTVENPCCKDEEENCSSCEASMVNGQCPNTYCRFHAAADRFEESIYPDLDVSELVSGILLESL